MEKILCATHAVGPIVLPVMIFHQMQLMVCEVIARQYALRSAAADLDGAVNRSKV